MPVTINLISHPLIFPYLIIRAVPSLYHIILLPKISNKENFKLALTQYSFNNLDLCLVFSKNSCIYFNDKGFNTNKEIPKGGTVLTNKLKQCFSLKSASLVDPSFNTRYQILIDYIKQQKREGYMFGDLTKGGRPATKDELIKLNNNKNSNIPKGLTLCHKCKFYKGSCLDPSPNFKNKVMMVNCLCDNTNICAKCNERLYKFKLNSNYFETEDNQIWHVPGFLAFRHIC